LNENALQPFGNGEISTEEAIQLGMEPFSRFMRDIVEDKNVELFCDLAGGLVFDSIEDVPLSIIIPAFILGEMTMGFLIGFVMYLPFIVIDMVVASILMAMGMMMLPPAMISMPFKILLFILMGGWSFIFEYIMRTFVP
jgi:flagellar biosynthetic protein FliP